jgi:LysM repeat protein
MVQTALREFARSIPGRPLDDQSVRLQADDELARLRRDNDELRAELATLRGGAATPLPRGPRMITLPEEVRTVPPPAPAPQTYAPILTETPVSAAPRREPERAVTPAPQPQKNPPPPRASGRTHTVRAGENLFRIGQHYGLKADQLAAANRDVLPAGANSALRPGMILRIP